MTSTIPDQLPFNDKGNMLTIPQMGCLWRPNWPFEAELTVVDYMPVTGRYVWADEVGFTFPMHPTDLYELIRSYGVAGGRSYGWWVGRRRAQVYSLTRMVETNVVAEYGEDGLEGLRTMAKEWRQTMLAMGNGTLRQT